MAKKSNSGSLIWAKHQFCKQHFCQKVSSVSLQIWRRFILQAVFRPFGSHTPTKMIVEYPLGWALSCFYLFLSSRSQSPPAGLNFVGIGFNDFVWINQWHNLRNATNQVEYFLPDDLDLERSIGYITKIFDISLE